MSTQTWIILGAIAVLLAGIGRINRKAEASFDPGIHLNAFTVTSVAAVGIIILIVWLFQ